MKKIVLFVMMTVSVAFAKDAEKKEKNKRDPASPALVQAYLEVAEQLSIERKNGNVCDSNAYPGEVLQMVLAASGLESFTPSLVKQTTREQMSKIIAFKEIMGQFSEDDRSVGNYKKALENADFYSPAMGVMGSTTKMELLPAGKMKMSIRSWDNDDIRTDVYEGTWQVSAPTKRSDGLMRLSIIYNGKKGQKTLVYRLGFTYEGGRKMWILHNKRNPSSRQIEYQYIKFFNEIIDECEV